MSKLSWDVCTETKKIACANELWDFRVPLGFHGCIQDLVMQKRKGRMDKEKNSTGTTTAENMF